MLLLKGVPRLPLLLVGPGAGTCIWAHRLWLWLTFLVQPGLVKRIRTSSQAFWRTRKEPPSRGNIEMTADLSHQTAAHHSACKNGRIDASPASWYPLPGAITCQLAYTAVIIARLRSIHQTDSVSFSSHVLGINDALQPLNPLYHLFGILFIWYIYTYIKSLYMVKIQNKHFLISYEVTQLPFKL